MGNGTEASKLLEDLSDAQLCRLAVLTMYGKIFPGKMPDRDTLILYSVLLEPMTVQTLSASMQKLALKQSFWPSVAEISSAAESLRQTKENDRTPTYEEAWLEVMHEMEEKAFTGRSPQFSTPTIRRVVHGMGWRALCEVTVEKLPTVRAQFREFYNKAVERERNEKQNQAILDSAEQTSNLFLKGGFSFSSNEPAQLEEQAR